MQNSLLLKVKEIVKSVFSTGLQIENDKMDQMLNLIGEEVKIFIKDEQSSVSKQLAKKMKQLFILSSDNQSLRQKISDMDNKIKRLLDKLGQKQKHIVKLMNDKQRQRRQLQQNYIQIINVNNKQIQNLQIKVFETQSRYKSEILDLRKIHKQEISKAIIRQQQIAENNIQKQKNQYNQDRKNLIQTQNKQKSQLIKKYQHKLQDLRDNHQQQIYKLNIQHNQIKEKDKKIKNDLNNQLFNADNNIKKLQGELSKQTLSHNKYKNFSQSLTSQLQNYQIQHKKAIQQLQTKLQNGQQQQIKNQRKLNSQIQGLKQLLQKTIQQKDLLFEQTVNTMKNEHNDQLQQTKCMLIQAKQIALNDNEIKHYNEIQKINGQYYTLQRDYNKLKQSYTTIQQSYQNKIKKIIIDYQTTIESIQNRNSYELNLQGQFSKKNKQVIQRKYRLQIKSLKQQFQQMKQQLNRKIIQQRVSTTNKLTTKYQTMINDIKINNEVASKQKLIQFDRKSKAYQKKLSQAQKRRVDLKILMDRHKLQMQIKIQSLSQLIDKMQSQIQQLHHHIIKLQKQKTTISNQFEFKLLIKKNQLQQAKDDYQIKQHQLKNIFNQNIRIKNTQIQKFSEKVTLQVQQLLLKHNKRVQILQKQYNQLKNIMNQRTSLPQDIQALKIFHQGYLKLQTQIEKQKQNKLNLQRQLQSKCAIQKVFVSKSFIPKIQDPNPIKVVTMKQFFKKQQKLTKFKSQNL